LQRNEVGSYKSFGIAPIGMYRPPIEVHHILARSASRLHVAKLLQIFAKTPQEHKSALQRKFQGVSFDI